MGIDWLFKYQFRYSDNAISPAYYDSATVGESFVRNGVDIQGRDFISPTHIVPFHQTEVSLRECLV